MAEKRTYENAFSGDYDVPAIIKLFKRKNSKISKLFGDVDEDDDKLNLKFNSKKPLAEEESKLAKIAEQNRLREERKTEEMNVLNVLKLMKQKERQRVENETREKLKILDDLEREERDRHEAAEALILMSKGLILMSKGISNLDTSESEENAKRIERELLSKFRLTEKKIKVVPYKAP